MTVGHTSFPKTSRLKLASDFRDILKNGKSFRESGLVLYFRKSSTKDSRLGIVVSKRVLKRAVDRNRVKRVIREYFRKEKANFSIASDIVIRTFQDHQLLNSSNLREILSKLFKKAHG